MTQDPVTPPPTGTPDPGNRPASAGPIYRSVADGELKTPWTLPEYFASLNTVMRLPAKVRRTAEAAAKRTPGGTALLASIDRIRIPKALIAASFVLALVVLVLRPLLLDASGSSSDGDLTKTYGVWAATKGKYEGRAFEVKADSIGFSDNAKSPNRNWYQVKTVHTQAAGDSTLYTVSYEDTGRSVEFAFWYVQEGQPAIRLKNLPGITWAKFTGRPGAPSKR